MAPKKQKKPVLIKEEKSDASITDEEIKEYLEAKEKVDKYKKKMLGKFEENPKKKELLKRELMKKKTKEYMEKHKDKYKGKYKETKAKYSRSKRMCKYCGKEYMISGWYNHCITKKHVDNIKKTL